MHPNAAPHPANEARRLETLHRLEILDTLPEQAYDDLTLLASQICGVPIAIVALLDAERQWYKSTVGTSLKETARDEAFCAHAILEPDAVFTVRDTQADPRFADNAWVIGDPHIRFYAGAPIVMSSGEAIGTLCVIDTIPRELTDTQRLCLQALARQASSRLDLRLRAIDSERVARESEQTTVEARLKQKRGMELLELVLRGGQMGLWDLHVPSGVWTVNAREQMMLGHAGVDASPDALDWRSLIHPDDWPALADAMEPHMNGRASFYEATHRMRHADGHYIWVLDRGVIVERNVRGEALRIVGTHVDVTEQKQKDEAERLAAERLELALSGGGHGLWDWHVPSGRLIRDRHSLSMHGLPPAGEPEDVERLWQTVAFDDDRERARIAMRRHLVGLTPMFEAELPMRHHDGRLLWMLYRAKVFERDEAGRALRVVGTSMNITDRKNGELALRETTELLSRTARLAAIGGWTLDVPTSTVAWSDEIYRIHDLSAAEKPDLRQALAFYTPSSRETLEAALARCIADGTPWDLELSLTTARGRSVWVRTIGRAEEDDGRIVRVTGTSQDVTARRVAEQSRLESDRRLRLMADSLPALITRLDRDRRYTFVNSEVERTFGIDRDTMIGKTMQEVRTIREGLPYETIAAHVATVLSGERVVFEGYAEVRGRPYHYESHYEPDVDEAGHVVGFFTMTFDVTERKRSEMRRAESEERLRGITDNLPVLIAELDTRGRFRFANETYRTWFGVDPRSIVGLPVAAALGVDHYESRREFLDRAFAGEKVSFVKALALRIGPRNLQTIYLPHRDGSGRVAGVYALTSDVTELDETQRPLDRVRASNGEP